MSLDEELQEHAEHAHQPFDKKVALTMAAIAAVIAVVGVLGHIYNTEELLAQQQASDQWAYYQAKDIRRYDSEVARDILKAIPGEAAGKAAEKYNGNAERYDKDREEIQEKAKELETESKTRGRQALRLHIGEVFLEIAIVLASLAILSKRSAAWYGSILSAAMGAAIAASYLLIH